MFIGAIAGFFGRDRQRAHAPDGRRPRLPEPAPRDRDRDRPRARASSTPSWRSAIVAIPIYARVMRASVLSIREQDFVTASRALGESRIGILRRRIMPNALTPLIVQGTLGIAGAIIDVAALSFLGLGAQPPLAEWGSMIGIERNAVFAAPAPHPLPGPRHRHHRASPSTSSATASATPSTRGSTDDLPDRPHPARRAAPSSRSWRPPRLSASRGRARSDRPARGAGPAHLVPHPRRRRPGRRRDRLPRRPRRGPGPRRRVGLRQERDLALDPAPRRQAGPDRGRARSCSTAATSSRSARTRCARSGASRSP